MTAEPRPYRAGETIQDLCRACKAPRDHTVIAADGEGRPVRVMCGFCGSQHNYRGGGGDEAAARPRATSAPRLHSAGEPFDLVAETERMAVPMALTSDASVADLEALLRRIIREETGLTPVAPAEKWRGGSLVLRPGKPGVQEKAWPIETFFHKVVMLRNRLRTMEQQINASELPEDEKVRLQSYLTGCYGSLTSFNVLFADEKDQFRGSAGE
jgi:hypothetical protein